MPTLTMAAADTIPSGGNEFGITNVSSQGNVSITVVPPRQLSFRGKSLPPEERVVKSNLTQSSPRYVTNLSLNASSSVGGHEQNELDEILRDLLGESHTSAGNVKTTSRINKSADSKGSETAGSSWLEQQQWKLNQRQQSRDKDDVSQVHRQQRQLVSELKHVQSRRRTPSDYNANNTYTTEKDIFVSTPSPEPSAYTVYIKPDEFKKQPQEDTSSHVTKKSVTNVSHTHHTHYNFHDNSSDDVDDIMQQTLEDQKRRIAQLEDELRKVKMGLEKAPPRPDKLELDDEEEEMLFKPVGIASLESGTACRVIRLPHSTSFNSDASPVLKSNLTCRQVSTPNGLPAVQTHAYHTQSSYGGTVTSPSSSGGVRSPYSNIGGSPLSPSTPYQLIASAGPLSPDYGHSMSQQQRITMEEQRIQQQQFYQQAGTMNQNGTLPSQSTVISHSQTNHQNHQVPASPQHRSYTHDNDTTSMANTESKTPTTAVPINQTLHVNTNACSNTSTLVADIKHSSGGNSGRSQFFSDSPDAAGDHLTAKFVKDTSKYWYKPHISREEATKQLKNAAPGTFIVRDSNSFPGAFGLALKVAHLPPNVQIKSNNDPAAEYVRFYLIEPTAKGVRLKGCSNEPVFASLASLIYQHTITPLALPCKLLLPDPDQYQFGGLPISSTPGILDEIDGRALESPGLSTGSDKLSSATDLLKRGADTESLTGPQAISRALHKTFGKDMLDTTVATFKVASDGITVTDTNRKLFFRHHFPKDSISYCGMDPADRRFTQMLPDNTAIREAKIFGFVAKKKGGNQCLLFAEHDPEQPGSAIVNFVTKILLNK